MKTVQEYLVEVIEAELPAFIRVFEALPTDQLEWRPDPKSRSAIVLASSMAEEPHQLLEVMETGAFDFKAGEQPKFNSGQEAAVRFKNAMEKLKAIIVGMDEQAWKSEAKMLVNGEDMWKTTKGEMAWGFIFDLIHHRGQLATYIRPMGGKVPAIYGPSADSNG
jgi:uncharacterized damage-inducible protein DinB